MINVKGIYQIFNYIKNYFQNPKYAETYWSLYVYGYLTEKQASKLIDVKCK